MRVGIKSGTWRLVLPGHIWCLEECKKHCDYLIVLTNEDKIIEDRKGFVPIGLEARKYILSNIKAVDEVGHFSGYTEDFWISCFRQERLKQEFGVDSKLVVFHTSEIQNEHWVPGKNDADKIIFIPRIEGSTTDIIKEIKKYG